MILSAQQIYAIARAAGFPPLIAVTMTAIALRESSGNPKAFNGNSATGDASYGLWQINMFGPLREPRLKIFGIADPDELLDPAVNARAALALWAHRNQNLAIGWYIDRGDYKTRYEKFLPAAQAAALAIEAAA